jgi:hypothetical protein
MNARLSRFVACLAIVLGFGLMASPARAVAVTVDLTRLIAIQTYALEDKADDEAFLVLTGVAGGKDLDFQKLPVNGAWKIGPQAPAVEPEKPQALWKGELDDGQFAQLTVTLFQGKGDDATVKAFLAKKAEAEKPIAARSGAKLASADEAKKLAADTLKAHKALIKGAQGADQGHQDRRRRPRKEDRSLRRAVHAAGLEQRRQDRQAARPGRPDVRRACRHRRQDLYQDQAHPPQRHDEGRFGQLVRGRDADAE